MQMYNDELGYFERPDMLDIDKEQVSDAPLPVLRARASAWGRGILFARARLHTSAKVPLSI